MTDRVYSTLSDVALSSLDDSNDLPELVSMSAEQFDRYYPLWLLYVGTDRKHLPWEGGLDDQPYIAMQAILELDTYYGKLLSQLKEDEDEAVTDGT